MVNVLLTHEVADFASWKVGFESDEPNRAQAGVKIVQVFNDVDNPNIVTVLTEFPSIEAVHGFVNSPGLKAGMEKAGVVGKPEFKILNKV